jgi:chromosomal replication initiator protein
MAKASGIRQTRGRQVGDSAPKAAAAAPAADRALDSPLDTARGRLVEEALRQRLGDERYGVWFGDGVSIGVEAVPAVGDGNALQALPCVVVTAGNVFAQEWLRRTFRSDVEAVARAVCGAAATVVWRAATAVQPVAALMPRDEGSASEVADRPGRPAAAGADGRRLRGRPAQRRTEADVTPDAAPHAAAGAAAGADRAGSRRRPSSPEHGPRGLVVSGAVPAASSGFMRRGCAELAAFVVGPSNRMAHAAAELAAARPGEMSPLLVHGPSGVGKTHLLEGICGRFRGLHPGSTALVLSAEQFTTGFLQALHGGGLPGFRRTCRQADLLVIDDLQFFAGKRATTLELQQTVDAFHRHGRQIVFAADRDLAALDFLGPDLVTRLRGGMTARIEPPDYDVRRGIVAGIAARRGLTLPAEVCHYVATSMTRHARELIGAVNRLEATSHMLGLPVTPEVAEEALTDLVRASSRSVRLADIERAVCAAFGIETGSLQSSRRARTVNHPRMLAMFLARRHTSSALTEIGAYFGRRSHSTVIAAQKAVDEWVSRRSKIVLADATWDVEEAIRRVEDVLRAG